MLCSCLLVAAAKEGKKIMQITTFAQLHGKCNFIVWFVSRIENDAPSG
eukprot:XP_001706975.1 Hypothetical protein GL50803_22279 [Giardia lamblia ATCC 50803]